MCTRLQCILCTVFGKHCECNAQKCTHLKRLPPLGSHLLLLSRCVLTQHEGQKTKITCRTPRIERPIPGRLNMRLTTLLPVYSKPDGTSFALVKCRHFKLQITTCVENEKIQLTPKITNHLFTYYLNCACKSNPVCHFNNGWSSFCWLLMCNEISF